MSTDIDYAEFDQLFRERGGQARAKAPGFVRLLEDGVPQRYTPSRAGREGSTDPEKVRLQRNASASTLRNIGRTLAKETGYARYAALRVIVHDFEDGDGPVIIACIPVIGQAGKYEGRWSEDVGEWEAAP